MTITQRLSDLQFDLEFAKAPHDHLEFAQVPHDATEVIADAITAIAKLRDRIDELGGYHDDI